MNNFNSQSRNSSAIKTSMYGMFCTLIRLIASFVFRTFFVKVLSVNYLGINGLFTNVLLILSLADLGIITAITYRFYEPISRGDSYYIGMLMNFFKKIYGIIAIVITCLGFILMPFIKMLVADTSEIPPDINIYIVFGLFILNSVSSYVFSYKQTLISADQKDYIVAIVNTVVLIIQYIVQLLLLWVTKDYTLMLLVGILVIVILNYIVSIFITKKYPDVFAVKEMLSKEEQKKIFFDTKAAAYHKIGGVVLSGTDNLVLTKMVGLVATGIYSNYSMFMIGINSVIDRIVGNFAPIVGNAIHTSSREDYYRLFRRINFISLWIVSLVTIITELFINDFIELWLGSDFVFEKNITVVLCVQLYIHNVKIGNNSFLNATGLFIKDKIRPLIEALINLVVSIILTYFYGIIGVFIGTIASMLVTVSWRQPLILYRYSFKRSVWEYWKEHVFFLVITVSIAILLEYVKSLASLELNWLSFIMEVVLAFIFINIVLVVFNLRSIKILKSENGKK